MSDPRRSRAVTAEQLRAALAALGRADVVAPAVGHDALIGALLALVEAYARTQVDDPVALRSGYREAVLGLAGGDVPVARRTWALQLVARLHHTAEQLRDTPAAPLVDVAGPAALAAANAVVLLHHASPSPDAVAEAVTTAAANLDAAQGALDRLRADLRADGFAV